MKKSTVILSLAISALFVLALPLLTLKLMKYGIDDHIAQAILIVYFLILAIQCAYTIKWLSQYQKEQEQTNRNGNSMPSKKCYALPDLETIASISIIISKKYAKVIFNTFDMQYKHEADEVIVELAMGYYLTFNEKGLIPEVNTKSRVIHVNNYVEKAIVDLRTDYNAQS